MNQPEQSGNSQSVEPPAPGNATPDPRTGPSPEAQAAAAPAKEAVHEAVQSIKTAAEAARVAEDLVAAAGEATEKEVRERNAAPPQPSAAIQETAATKAGQEKAPATLVEAARQVALSDGEEREALEQAIQEVTAPEQHGRGDSADVAPLDLLRGAILHQMKPHQALDARLYLAINHLPHTPLTNQVMNVITSSMNGGMFWMAALVVATLVDRKQGRRALLQIVPPLSFATMTVEYPIKYYFRRRRPFVDIVQAVAVGKKPGTYSFPSGHSAAAFAGAWLMTRHFPRLAPAWYSVAALVGFSRIYLGVHYPGDVISGALSGTALAELTRWVIDKGGDVDAA
jgi:undecaprenyl-diphosphatase